MIPLQIWPSVLSLSSANECAWMGESACFSVLTKKDCVILPYTSRSCSPFSSVILHEVRLRMKSSTRYISLSIYIYTYAIALHWIASHYIIPFHSIPLDAIRLHCNVYTMSCCHTYITLSYVHYITIQYITLQYITLQCIALHIALHVALHLHDTTLHYHTSIHPSIHPCIRTFVVWVAVDLHFELASLQVVQSKKALCRYLSPKWGIAWPCWVPCVHGVAGPCMRRQRNGKLVLKWILKAICWYSHMAWVTEVAVVTMDSFAALSCNVASGTLNCWRICKEGTSLHVRSSHHWDNACQHQMLWRVPYLLRTTLHSDVLMYWHVLKLLKQKTVDNKKSHQATKRATDSDCTLHSSRCKHCELHTSKILQVGYTNIFNFCVGCLRPG